MFDIISSVVMGTIGLVVDTVVFIGSTILML